MNNQMREIAKKRFQVELEALQDGEQRVVQHFGERKPISRDTNREFETKLTFGQRLADQVAEFGGSWTFILIFAAILIAWVLINSVLLARSGSSFDPYPYAKSNEIWAPELTDSTTGRQGGASDDGLSGNGETAGGAIGDDDRVDRRLVRLLRQVVVGDRDAIHARRKVEVDRAIEPTWTRSRVWSRAASCTRSRRSHGSALTRR